MLEMQLLAAQCLQGKLYAMIYTTAHEQKEGQGQPAQLQAGAHLLSLLSISCLQTSQMLQALCCSLGGGISRSADQPTHLGYLTLQVHY